MSAIPFRGTIDRNVYVRSLRLAGLAPRTLGIILLAAGVWGLVTFSVPSRPATWGAPLFVAILGGYTLLAPYLAARRLFATSATITSPLTGHADDAMFVAETEHGRSNIKWEDFHKAIVDRELVLLFLSGQQFHALPRAFFGSDAEWSQFQDLVRAKVPEKHGQSAVWKTLILWLAIILAVVVAWSFVK